jgi:ubiquinone/menaquinone biosynthesis C-methylase UbiE
MINTEIDRLLTVFAGLSLACPMCKGDLLAAVDVFQCSHCVRRFPIINGIPDFRVYSDPYLSFEEDMRRVQLVLDKFNDHSFEQLLHYYWSFSDTTPNSLRSKYIAAAILAEKKSETWLDSFAERNSTNSFSLLDVGCGTGGLLLAAQKRGLNVVGADIAMRWLQITRKRFVEAGEQTPPLICCCAEYLPFRSNQFDAIVLSQTYEFVKNQSMLIAETTRLLTDQGSTVIRTVNRFALGKDPYVHLFGIGFLPRNMQAIYARLLAGADYGKIYLNGLNEIRRKAERHYQSVAVSLPDLDWRTISQESLITRVQAYLYEKLKQYSFFFQFLLNFGPGWTLKLSRPRPVASVNHSYPQATRGSEELHD